MSESIESANSAQSRFVTRLPVILLLFLSFAAYSVKRAPVPGVNEPHYLTKAKHYWNPQWCADDIFLQSTNTHIVFYQTIGILTNWFTLEQTAWIARVVVLLLLTVAWDSLMQQLLPNRWMSLWTAWCFLFFSAIGNFSGEWMVGGVESKGFSYAFVFLMLSAWMRKQPLWAGTFAGLAISFHPIVGCWSLIAGLFAFIINWLVRRKENQSVAETIPRKKYLLAFGLLILCALPGLIPAFQMLASVPHEIAVKADHLQVYFRLKHHLDPMVFSGLRYFVYGFLLILFCGASWGFNKIESMKSKEHRIFFWYVIGAFLIALAGVIVSYRTGTPEEMWMKDFRTFLLKFYTSRLFDVMMLVAASVTLVRFTGWLISPHAGNERQSVKQQSVRHILVWLLFAGGLLGTILIPSIDARPRRLSTAQQAAWQEACLWIKTNTPEDAIVLTPRTNWAFRWFAERTDYVSYKDCPQDAPSIVKWHKRFYAMRTRVKRAMKDKLVTLKEFDDWHNKTGVTYLLESYRTKERLGNVEAKPVFKNDYYRLFALGK